MVNSYEFYISLLNIYICVLRLRPERIRWSSEDKQYPLAVFNQPHPKDIIQGRLGNCWLIAALSLIAEVPQILYKVMITKQYNSAGKKMNIFIRK
jgi:hypothetical protein